MTSMPEILQKKVLNRVEVMALYEIRNEVLSVEMKKGFPHSLVGGKAQFHRDAIDKWYLEKQL